jgi:hypothetical protein
MTNPELVNTDGFRLAVRFIRPLYPETLSVVIPCYRHRIESDVLIANEAEKSLPQDTFHDEATFQMSLAEC